MAKSLQKHAHRMPELAREWPASVLSPWRWIDERFEPGSKRQLIDVEEFTEDGTLVVRAELPGIDPEHDVDITVSDGTLSISAQRSEEQAREGRRFHRRELRYGVFVRRIPLPEGADEGSVAATYHDGILEVRVPMPAASALEPARHVPVIRA
jgi:HSP20 family protein